MKKSFKYQDNLFTRFAPITIILVLLIGFFVFKFVFAKYNEYIVITDNGFFLKENEELDKLVNKEIDKLDRNIETIDVKVDDRVYKNKLGQYKDNSMKNNLNIQYPLFINDGITIINYNDEVNLISNTLSRTVGTKNTVINYGRIYSLNDYTQVDQEKYLLMNYSNNIFVNLYDLKIKVNNNEYNLPINSFLTLNEEYINYYKRENNKFVRGSIIMDLQADILFSFDGNKEEYLYKYEDLLIGLGFFYKEEAPKENEKIIDEKDQKEVIDNKPVKNPSNKIVTGESKPGEFVWIKPKVVSGKLSANIYSMDGSIEVSDPAGVIVKQPTYNLYVDGKIYSKRSYYGSGNFSITGLKPSQTYTLVGQYTYLDQDMKTQKLVTFYTNTLTTSGIEKLNPVKLSFKKGDIHSKKIEIDELMITSDLNDEAIKGIVAGAIVIDEKRHALSRENVLLYLFNGMPVDDVYSNETLKPNSEYNYRIEFYDSANNIIKIQNNEGSTRTCKREPTLSIRILDNLVDSITFQANLKNTDEIEMSNYHYIVTNEAMRVIRQAEVTDSTIVLSDIDPNQLFTISFYADYDLNNEKGLMKDNLLGSLEFTSLPLSSLGFLNISFNEIELGSVKNELSFKIESSKTDARLIKILKHFNIKIINNETEEIVKTYNLNNSEINNFKIYKDIHLSIDGLDSNTEYRVELKSTVMQGETAYDLDCVYSYTNFKTKKLEPVVSIKNMFVTSNMIDYDIKVIDTDGTILNNSVVIELRDEKNELVSVSSINTNSEDFERIIWEKLEVNKNYLMKVYAPEYNATDSSTTYESKKYIYENIVLTEDGISGDINLQSAKRMAKGSNLLDIYSETKWIQTLQYYNMPKKTDIDGIMHMYANKGNAEYQYDFSEYAGEFITFSFKIKAINPFNTSIYFGSYVSGSSDKLLSVSTSEWKEYKFTYRIGFNTNGTYYTSKTYNKNNHNSLGFYITNTPTGKDIAEYVIKDVHAYISREQTKIEIEEDNEIVSGSWTRSGNNMLTVEDNTDTYMRNSKPFHMEAGKTYSINFSEYEDMNVQAYVTLINSDTNKYSTNLNWFYTGYSYTPTINADAYIYYRSVDISNYKLELEIREFSPEVKKAYSDFEYDYITTVKIDLADKHNEITNDTYYIRMFDKETNELLNELSYVELEDTDYLTKVVKRLELDENKQYIIQLDIKLRDRYYTLDKFELDTSEEVIGIENLDEWSYIQPYGSYIILNDLNFIGNTTQTLGHGSRYFYGTLDFQGYRAITNTGTLNNSSAVVYRKIGRLGAGGVIKNMVLEVHIDHTLSSGSYQGFIGANYGLIENVYVDVYDERANALTDTNGTVLLYENLKTGILRNFVIHAHTDIKFYRYNSILVGSNYGLIENGYYYGGDIISSFTGATAAENISVITRGNGATGIVRNVYAVGNIKFVDNTNYDYGSFISTDSDGTIENVYVVGDTNFLKPQYGPIVNSFKNAATLENAYYLSENLYTMSNQTKINAISLNSESFQRSVLGDSFNYETTVKLGYYPHVIYTSDSMPKQEYVTLPQPQETEELDILNFTMLEKGNDYAIFESDVYNPLGNTIDNIGISYLQVEVLDQSFTGNQSKVKFKVSEPTTFKSKYQVNNIESTDFMNYKHTTTYLAGEKYLFVDLYKEIYTIDDWKKGSKSLGENYILMNDLDFTGATGIVWGTFTGKIDGNYKTIRNIEIARTTYTGLISALQGEIKNLYIEDYKYEANNTVYNGVFGNMNRYGKLLNVHIKNVEIIVDDTRTSASSTNVGGIVGYCSYGRITNSSISNVKITSYGQLTQLAVGGMVGYGDGVQITNSYVSNVDIDVKNAISTVAVGGIIGRDTSSLGFMENCYATGIVRSNGVNTSGLIGQGNDYINNCYSAVNVVSESTSFAGINAQPTSSNVNKMTNNIFLGTMYSSLLETISSKVAPYFEVDPSNYALKDGLINGFSSEKDYVPNGETLIYTNEINKYKYEEIFDDNHCYLISDDPTILPKIKYTDKDELLPNQEDTYLFKDMFEVEEIDVVKHPTYAYVAMKINNPDNYEITKLEVQYASTLVTKNITENGVTTIQMNLTPDRYVDTYMLNNIGYKDSEGIERNFTKSIRIETVFYRELSSYDDWQNVDSLIAENYLVTNDFDMSGKEIKTGLLFNRLESSSDGVIHTISGISKEIDSKNYNLAVISKINTTLKDVEFKDVEFINKNTTNNINYFNFISFQIGSMENVKFSNFNIDGNTRTYVSIIGTMNGYSANNITMDNIKVNGKSDVAALFAYLDTSNKTIKNIYANNLNIRGTLDYVGGVIGQSNSPGEFTNFMVTNSYIYGEGKYIGGIAAYGTASHSTVQNTTVEGKTYVGGAFGSAAIVNPEEIVIDNCDVIGTGQYIGGFTGIIGGINIYDIVVKNSRITGTATSEGVGGIVGRSSHYGINRARIEDSVVSSEGIYTGGIVGYSQNSTLQYIGVDNVIVAGNTYVSGVSGKHADGSLTSINLSNSTINAKEYAGGVVGLFDNINTITTFREGRIYNILLENNRIHANSYAGGFIGDSNNLLVNTNNNYVLYFDGDISTQDGTSQFGIGGGSVEFNKQFLNQDRIGIYEGSTIDGNTIGSLIKSDKTKTENLLTEFVDGNVNTSNGSVVKDLNYPSAISSNLIQLSGGKRYTVVAVPTHAAQYFFRIAFYDPTGKFLGAQLSSGNVVPYATQTHTEDFQTKLSFNILKDCQIRVYCLYGDSSFSEIGVYEEYNDTGVTKAIVLSNEQIHERNIWIQYNEGTTSTSLAHATYFELDYRYWDTTGLNSPQHAVKFKNEVNGVEYTANVSNANTQGFFINGEGDNIKLNNFTLDQEFTLNMTISSYASRNSQIIFGSRFDTSSGFLLLVHGRRISARVNNTDYNFNYFIPLFQPFYITVKCYNDPTPTVKKKYVSLYVNGEFIQTLSSNHREMKVESNAETYLGYNAINPATGNAFVGYISDFAYYNTLLSDEDIRNNYRSHTNSTQGLKYSFDFTRYKSDFRNYYPRVRYTNTYTLDNFEILKEIRKVYMPELLEYNASSNRTLLVPLSSSSMQDKYHVYASSINTINLEFDNISDDLKVDYIYKGETYTVDVDERVLSFYYYFDDDVRFRIYNYSEDFNVDYTKEDLMNSIGIYNDNYYVIKSNGLYSNNTLVVNNALHIYNNLVLTQDNIYNLATNSTETREIKNGLSSYTIPLYSSTYNGITIKTFYNYSLVCDPNGSISQRLGQIVYKDDKIYALTDEGLYGNYSLFNTYNNSSYIIGLYSNNKIYSYDTDINIPNDILNNNIIEMTYDINSNNPIVMIKYDNDSIRVFNYLSGEIIYQEGDLPVIPLMSFLYSKTVASNPNVSSNNPKSLLKSVNLVNKLENIEDNNIQEHYDNINTPIKDIENIDITIINDDNEEKTTIIETSNQTISNNYVTTYNRNTGEYDVYSTSDLINPDIKEVKTEYVKIAKDSYLYDYFFKDNTNNKVLTNRNYILYAIIAFVIINLSIFVYKYQRRSHEN